MNLIREIGADKFRIQGYSFLSFNKRGAETTAYYVHDLNLRQGIGVSLFTSDHDVTINVSSYNLFYQEDLSFDEAFISGFGGLVEEDRQACLELLAKVCDSIPRYYKINYASNVQSYVLGEAKSCLK